MIEKIDFSGERDVYNDLIIIFLKLNEVIDAINPPICCMCGQPVIRNTYQIVDGKVRCGFSCIDKLKKGDDIK